MSKWISGNVFVLLSVFTLVLGLLGLAKDLQKFRKFGAGLYLFCLMSLFFLGIWKETESKRLAAESSNKISALQQEVHDGRITYERYEQAAQLALSRLNEKMIDLRTQIATETLKDQLNETQQQLLKTNIELSTMQRKLSPPKAEFSFGVFRSPSQIGNSLNSPIREIDATENAGTVEIQVIATNISSVPAVNGEFRLRICDGCSYSSEPPGWYSIAEFPHNRNIKFALIGSHVAFQPVKFAFRAPSPCTHRVVELGFSYECENCKVDYQLQKIRINIVPGALCVKLIPQ